MLKNDLIQLRAIEPEDLELLYKWENNPALWVVGNTRNPYSRYMLKQYILNSGKDIYENGNLRLMIQSMIDGATVGTVDLFDLDVHNSRIALGLYVDKNHQGKGFAREALHLTEEYVFDFMHVNQLYCEIAKSNSASRSMFEKEGYEQHGVLKNWIKTQNGFEDILVFQRFRNK